MKAHLQYVVVCLIVQLVACTLCPYGKYANSTVCTPCSEGFWCPGGLSAPIECTSSEWCAVIFYSMGISMDEINPRIFYTFDPPSGTCAISHEQTACQTTETVTHNYYLPRWFSSLGSDKKYHNGYFFLPCAQCVAGTYISSECNGESLDANMCSACEDGYYCPGDGMRYACKTCAPNKELTCTSLQDTECIPDGFFSNGTAIKECRSKCGPGSIEIKPCNVTDRVCQPCNAGFYCHDNNKYPCPPGSTGPPNATSYMDCYCKPGASGMVISRNETKCTQCAIGSFCPGVNAKTACNC